MYIVNSIQINIYIYIAILVNSNKILRNHITKLYCKIFYLFEYIKIQKPIWS